MKKLGYIVSLLLYYIGDFTCYIMEKTELYGLFYPVYNKLMWWSLDIQRYFNGDGPWE